MTSRLPTDSLPDTTLPAGWAEALKPLLEPGEKVSAWVAPDLDQNLHFVSGALVLTSARLLARAPGESDWLAWPLMQSMSLPHRDHAGVGTIELFDGPVRIACWHHTLGMTPAVRRMSDLFSTMQKLIADPDLHIEPPVAACPTCGTPFAPDSDECAVCNEDAPGPSSTWALLRLGRFARWWP